MGENVQIIIAILLLAGAYLLSRKMHAWRMRKACQAVFRDLDAKGAMDADNAVSLPYATTSIFRVGMRDHRPKALEFLMANELLERTPEGKFYFTEKGMAALRAMNAASVEGGGA